jgi:DNA-binding NarL/FixJ family response regulator
MPIRVAIVDDHRLIRDALSDLISAEPDIDIVASVGDGAAAVQAAGEARPDVLLLDIALPDANGLDLIGRIREHSPATRVLVLSMHSEPEYAAAARKRGARGLIAKSAPVEDLIDAIRTVADGDSIPVVGELTEREREILKHIGHGATNDEIASALDLQPKTVEAYGQQLMAKLGVRTRAGLIGRARRVDLQ